MDEKVATTRQKHKPTLSGSAVNFYRICLNFFLVFRPTRQMMEHMPHASFTEVVIK